MKHENILPLLGVWTNFGGRNANYPVPVSPWMDDGDLLSYLKKQKTVTTNERLIIVSISLSFTLYCSRILQLRDVASALGYRKPNNIVAFNHFAET